MPTIVQNISPALIEGATAIYIGGVRASALDASGNVLIDGNTTPPTQTAPTITAQPTISGTTAPTGLLTLAEGGASGNPVPTGTIQWYLDGVALIGENGLTIDKGQHGVGVYRATVIWANGVIPAATGQSNTITVAAQQTAPAITTQPTISGGTTVGDILTLARGAATGTPTPTAAIQWLRGTTVISGATGATYTLVSGDEGQAISARVTWTNSAGSVSVTSNAITVQASSDFNPALSAAYFDGTDYAQGAVATITSRGTAVATFASAGTGAEVINGTGGFNFSAGKYLLNSGGLGAVMRAHRFQVIMAMTINNLAAAPYLLNLGPATGNGRLQIQALANGRVRVQLRNASNTTIATHDAATIIQDGVPFTLSVSIENNLLSVDWGPGGVTSPISDEVAFNVSGANVSYDRVAIGALHANGAGSGMANMILESFIVMEIAA